MAIIVQQTFADGKLRLARSPLIVVLTETTGIVNNSGYRFILEVRVWKGNIGSVPALPKITLQAIPDPNKRGLFNVAPILQDIMTPEDPDDTGNVSTAGTYAIQLKYGRINIDDYYWHGTSPTTIFTDGFAKAPQKINEYDYFTLINSGLKILTPVQTSDIGTESEGWLHFFRGNLKDQYIIYQDQDNNGFIHKLGLPLTIATTQQTIGRIPVGIADVMVANSNSDLPSLTFNPTRFIRITLLNSSGGWANDQHIVNIVPKGFCDVEDDTISYVNRYGVWDYIHFKGRVKESINQESTKWNRRVTSFVDNVLQYPKGISQQGLIGVMGKTELTLQTGFVKDYINEKMIDLFMSKTHYSFRLKQSVTLESRNLDLMKDTNEDLINYTVQFSVSGNLIQNIQ